MKRSIADIFSGPSPLPDQLPADPMPMVCAWFEEAHQKRVQPNPNAIALATCTPDGRPSVRMVLCKEISPTQGWLVFYTNRQSRKGVELEANPRASVCFHWDALDRQIRIEGPVVHAPDADSDAYFRSRRWESRVGAWASAQSRPISSRGQMLDRVMETIGQLGLSLPGLLLSGNDAEIPRPPHWGGYRVWADSVEIWAGSATRIHDRARWVRNVTPSGGEMQVGAWEGTRLQP